MPADDDRIADLETRLAHHERLAEELSAEVARQAREIDALRERVRHLSDRVGSVEGTLPDNSADEPPPPHY